MGILCVSHEGGCFSRTNPLPVRRFISNFDIIQIFDFSKIIIGRHPPFLTSRFGSIFRPSVKGYAVIFYYFIHVSRGGLF